MNKKITLMMLLLMTATIGAYAQGNGIAGINEATKMVTSYFDPGTKLIYAVGAVVGLIVYVVKRKCTTANVVIYAVISFFYSQKFFC